MKTPGNFIAIITLIGLSGVVNAADNKQTLSLGYASSHYSGNISGSSPGINLKYNWEDKKSGFGAIGSVTRTSSDTTVDYSSAKGKISHLSVLAGPSYRLNERVSVYGLAGVSHDKLKIQDASGNINSFAYGAGLRVSPVKNWSIDASYERVRNSDGDKTSAPLKIGTWALGVGYSF